MALGSFTLSAAEFTKLANAHVRLYANNVLVTGGATFPTGTVLRADTYDNYMFTDASYPPDDGYDDFGYEIAIIDSGVQTSVKFMPIGAKYSRSHTISASINYLSTTYIHTAIDPNPPAQGWVVNDGSFGYIDRAHVDIIVNGVKMTAVGTVPYGATLKFVARTGYRFTETSFIKIVTADGTTELDPPLYATMSADMTISDFGTLAKPTSPAGADHYGQVGACQTEAYTPPAPLAWNVHPATGTPDTDIPFSWTGGEPGANGYNLVVFESDGVTITDDQTTAALTANVNESAGTYTVKVYDKGGRNDPTAHVIEQQLTLTTLLHWVDHPTTATAGDTVKYSWGDGTKPSGGYLVTVTDPDNTKIQDGAIDNTEYSFIAAKAGNYSVSVTDNITTLNETLVVAAPPLAVFDVNDYNAMRSVFVNGTVNGVAFDGSKNVGLFAGDKLVFTCEQDYKFIDDVNGVSIGFNMSDGSKVHMTLDPTDKIASYTMVDKSPLTYDQMFITTRKIPDNVAANNVYLVDNQIINTLSSTRFQIVPNSEGTALVAVDYGDFIIDLIELPFAIDPAMIGLDGTITLGGYDTKTIAPQLVDDKLVFYIGKVTVPETYGNSLDYHQTEALFHLPFINPVNIALEYVIGQQISVEYHVNAYSGKATVLISSSKINDVIIMKELDAGFKIPYANYARNNMDNSNIDIGGDNLVRRPYIELVRNDIALPNGVFTIPVTDEDQLKNHKGFVIVEQIELNCTALKNEKDEINSFLNKGVIIK